MTGCRSQTVMKMYLQIPRQQRSRSLGSYLAAEGNAAKFTFRDGNSQVTKFFERGTDEEAVIYEHGAAASKDQQFANLGFATLC
jgi:hypothetical protein